MYVPNPQCVSSTLSDTLGQIEGAFFYPSGSDSVQTEGRRHVFFTQSQVIPVDVSDSASKFTFRDAFMRRRPSASNIGLKSGLMERSYPFQFTLPQGPHAKQELPPSFVSQEIDGNPLVTSSEISYQITATWEPDKMDQPSSQ